MLIKFQGRDSCMDAHPFTYAGYTLYWREMPWAGARRRVWFFATEAPPAATPSAKPAGYEVGIHPHTGLPLLKRSEPLARSRAAAPPRAGHHAS